MVKVTLVHPGMSRTTGVTRGDFYKVLGSNGNLVELRILGNFRKKYVLGDGVTLNEFCTSVSVQNLGVAGL